MSGLREPCENQLQLAGFDVDPSGRAKAPAVLEHSSRFC